MYIVTEYQFQQLKNALYKSSAGTSSVLNEIQRQPVSTDKKLCGDGK